MPLIDDADDFAGAEEFCEKEDMPEFYQGAALASDGARRHHRDTAS